MSFEMFGENHQFIPCYPMLPFGKQLVKMEDPKLDKKKWVGLTQSTNMQK